MSTTDNRPARPVTDNWDWQLFAACRGLDVEIFYHPAGERRRDKVARISQAKQILNRCLLPDRRKRTNGSGSTGSSTRPSGRRVTTAPS